MSNEMFIHTKTHPRTTVCAVFTENSVMFGASRCSTKDSFSKKVGRERSILRAQKNPLKVLPLSEGLNRRDVFYIMQGIGKSVQIHADSLPYMPMEKVNKPIKRWNPETRTVETVESF
jgi:hypothetical protein